jgi:hypothetical protein
MGDSTFAECPLFVTLFGTAAEFGRDMRVRASRRHFCLRPFEGQKLDDVSPLAWLRRFGN